MVVGALRTPATQRAQEDVANCLEGRHICFLGRYDFSTGGCQSVRGLGVPFLCHGKDRPTPEQWAYAIARVYGSNRHPHFDQGGTERIETKMELVCITSWCVSSPRASEIVSGPRAGLHSHPGLARGSHPAPVEDVSGAALSRWLVRKCEPQRRGQRDPRP